MCGRITIDYRAGIDASIWKVGLGCYCHATAKRAELSEWVSKGTDRDMDFMVMIEYSDARNRYNRTHSLDHSSSLELRKFI